MATSKIPSTSPLANSSPASINCPPKTAAIILQCGSGLRGSIAIEGLRLLGYTNVLNMGGGLKAWKAAGFPVEGVVDWTAVWTDFLTNLPADYYTVKADVLKGQIDAGSAPFLLDVREAKRTGRQWLHQGRSEHPRSHRPPEPR